MVYRYKRDKGCDCNYYMAIKKTLFNVFLIFIYTLLLGCIYHVMTFRETLRDDVEHIVSSIDHHLKSVEDELRQLPIPEQCDEPYMTRLRHQVFSSVTLRGIVVGDPNGAFPNLCSNFGSYARRVDEKDWDYSSQGDLLFGKVKFSKYRRDSSYALAIRRANGLVIGLVNPRAILGWWVSPVSEDINITLLFTEEEDIKLERLNLPVNEDTYLYSEESEAYPYEILVHKSTSEVKHRIVTFGYRLLGLFVVLYSIVLIYFVRYQVRRDDVETS